MGEMSNFASDAAGPWAIGCSEKSKSVIKKKEHTHFGVVGYTNKEFHVKFELGHGKLVAFAILQNTPPP